MSVTGLFAGIGGFELAFGRAGFKTKLLVEIDPDAQAVLRAQFPEARIHSDVLDLDGIPPDTQLLTSGFPCQNLSMAGDKQGIDGAKSGVVKRMFQLIARSKVPIVVIENVYFMLQLDNGNGMRWLAQQFEELGYMWAYRVLNTMAFGLPQRRRRVFFVASRTIDPRAVLFADVAPPPGPLTPDMKKPIGFYWTEGRSGVGLTVDAIPPLKVGSALGIPSPPAVLFPDGAVLIPSLRACERLQGFPLGWTAAATSLRKGPRWRLLGNAVSVPVAEWVAARIRSPGAVLDFQRSLLREGRHWPDAGWNVGDGRFEVLASDRPVLVSAESIASYRDDEWRFLSDRALDGFITRAESGQLQMPTGFLAALRRAERL